MKKGTKKLAKGVTVEALIAQGNAALSNMQPELAVKFFERANGMSPMDTNVMDALADVHLQLGDQARALELLLTSTSLAPEANPFKWLYLAQLQEGLDSLSTYMRGIAILERMMKDTTDDTDVRYEHHGFAYLSPFCDQTCLITTAYYDTGKLD